MEKAGALVDWKYMTAGVWHLLHCGLVHDLFSIIVYQVAFQLRARTRRHQN
jgi:hypothetical protein